MLFTRFTKVSIACLIVISVVKNASAQSSDTLIYPDEKHFKNIQQLTFNGDNAEAYWSYDDKQVIFQRKNEKEGIMCDRMFTGIISQNGAAFQYKELGNGHGRATCGYFLPGGKQVVYASTHLGGDSCPPVPDRKQYDNRYLWPIYDSYDIFLADTSGKIIKQLTKTKGYDAEGTLSPDGKKIVWRASRPKTPEAIKDYKELLAKGLVAPTQMEVFIANADGSNTKQITALGQANWAPNFTPDGRRIIFCSNHEFAHGFPFNMYLMNLDGSSIEKISHGNGFDAFPMFSYDGKKLMFSSNRNSGGGYDINLFMVDWVE